MRYLIVILLLIAAYCWAEDATVTLLDTGATAGYSNILSPFANLAETGAATGAGTIKLPFANLSSTGAGTGYGTLKISTTTELTAQRAFTGYSSMRASGVIKNIVGHGAIAGIGGIRTLNAIYVPVKVVKLGNGSVYVKGEGIECGSDCETTVAKNSSITLTWSKDLTESDVYSWGNACTSAERATTCTIPTDAAGQRMYVESSGYAVASLVTGRFGDPICRTGRGTESIKLQPSLQVAYNEVANGRANMPIDCVLFSGDGPLVMNTSIGVEIVGGWTDFFPGQITEGVPTNINGGLTVKFGTFTVGSYNGAGAVVIR